MKTFSMQLNTIAAESMHIIRQSVIDAGGIINFDPETDLPFLYLDTMHEDGVEFYPAALEGDTLTVLGVDNIEITEQYNISQLDVFASCSIADYLLSLAGE